jgi:hypothetical protein
MRPQSTGVVTFHCHGARIEVRTHPGDLVEFVRGSLPPGAVEAQLGGADATFRWTCHGMVRGERRFSVHMGRRLLFAGPGLRQSLASLANALHLGVAIRARTHLFVHAGVVVWRDRAIVLPGRSMQGKSTLVDALVRKGAVYYSDECAPLDPKGTVSPYPKPLRLRSDMQANLAKAGARRPYDLGVGAGAAPIGMIVFTRYEAGAAWAPQRLSPGLTLLGLAQNTLLAFDRPARTLTVLKRVANEAPACVSLRGEADAAANAVLYLMDEYSTVPMYEPVNVPHESAILLGDL